MNEKVKNEPISNDNNINGSNIEIDIKLKFQNCPICLCNFDRNTIIANPDVCEHIFCLECLQEWSKKINTCPIDRKIFSFILKKNNKNQTIQKVKVEDRTRSYNDELEQDLTFCEICRQANREDRMLLCDSCDKGYHCECLSPPIDQIPEGEWFCPHCLASRLSNTMPSTSSSSSQQRIIARTNFAERIRRNVNQNRSNSRKKRSTTRKIKRKTHRRKKVKRIRRKANLKTTSASSSKSSKIVKKYKKSRKRIPLKGRKRTQSMKSYLKSKKTNPTKRILKKILDYDEKKDKKNTLPNINRASSGTFSLNDEDFASIQLTSQTVQFFDNQENKNIQNLKENKPSSSIHLLNSIMESQDILSKASSNIKINHNGSMELISQSNRSIKNINTELAKLRKTQSLPKPVIKQENVPIEEKKKLHTFNKQDKIVNELKNIKKEPVQQTSYQNKSNQIKFDFKKEISNSKMETEFEQTRLTGLNTKFKNDVLEKPVIKQENVPIEEKKKLHTFNKQDKIVNELKNIKKEPVEADKLNIGLKVDSNKCSVTSNLDYIQDQIVLICKQTLKPYFVEKKITKDEYKLIMKKVVNKVRVHVRNLESLNTKKVKDLTLAYIVRMNKSSNKI